MSVRWEFAMGPNRPNRPLNRILEIIDDAVREVLGDGARVVVTSGTENANEQFGSNRHSTGLAADVAIYRSSGERLTALSAETLSIMRAAARRGAKGFGWGPEYMGGRNFHIDMVEPGPGQNYTWGSEGVRHREEIVAIVTGTAAPSSEETEFLGNPLRNPMRDPFDGLFSDKNMNYTDVEKDFLSVYDVLERAQSNRPVLIELDNLLLPKRSNYG